MRMKRIPGKIIFIVVSAAMIVSLCLFIPRYVNDYAIRKDVWNQLKDHPDMRNTLSVLDWKKAKISKGDGEIFVDYDNGLIGFRVHIQPATHKILQIDPGA